MNSFNNLIRLAFFATALTAVSLHGDTFSYSYFFSGGPTINGTFNGVQSGNLITNITSATMFVNGTQIGSTIFAQGFDPTYSGTNPGVPWTENGAVVSFDGTQNSFAFNDTDVANGYFNHTGAFVFIPYNGGGYVEVQLHSSQGALTLQRWDHTPEYSNWSVRQIPDNGMTVTLLASALTGLALLRRRFMNQGQP